MNTTWPRPDSSDVAAFLGDSDLCDVGNPQVQRTTETLILEANSPKDAATNIYYYVRDEIKHQWVPALQRASLTLARRSGDCWPKSVTQVAMLRAANIPARFHWIEYHKTLFRDLVPSAVYENLADPFPFHVLGEVLLDGRWVQADATFDRSLRPDRARDWDGETDLLMLESDEISRDLGYTSSFEERIPDIERFLGVELSSSPEATDVECEVVNLYFDLIRFRNQADHACRRLLGATK